VRNRRKALYRSGAIPCRGPRVYGPYSRDHRSRGPSPGRDLLPTARRLADPTPASATRSVGGGPEAPRDEVAAADSFDRPDSSGSTYGSDPNAASLSHQATTRGLQRPGVEDLHQRDTAVERQLPLKPVGELTCFVISPFQPKPRFDDLFDLVNGICQEIRTILQLDSLSCMRSDTITSAGVIHPEIWQQVKQADIIVADVSGQNGT
jgi:hypothetical protein